MIPWKNLPLSHYSVIKRTTNSQRLISQPHTQHPPTWVSPLSILSPPPPLHPLPPSPPPTAPSSPPTGHPAQNATKPATHSSNAWIKMEYWMRSKTRIKRGKNVGMWRRCLGGNVRVVGYDDFSPSSISFVHLKISQRSESLPIPRLKEAELEDGTPRKKRRRS